MNSDADVKRDVEAELKWTPDVDDRELAVAVNDGAVTLTGFTGTLYEKYRAERAARRVRGVAAIANDIQVRSIQAGVTDPEIARAALAALRSAMPIASQEIRPMVHDGHVSLLGTVHWHYQRELAERLMQALSGVVSVRNSLEIKPRPVAAEDIKPRIEAAFRRLAQLDAERIRVEAKGSEITLRGNVRSWAEHDQAQATAWSAPGVSAVHNELTVRL